MANLYIVIELREMVAPTSESDLTPVNRCHTLYLNADAVYPRLILKQETVSIELRFGYMLCTQCLPTLALRMWTVVPQTMP